MTLAVRNKMSLDIYVISGHFFEIVHIHQKSPDICLIQVNKLVCMSNHGAKHMHKSNTF